MVCLSGGYFVGLFVDWWDVAVCSRRVVLGTCDWGCPSGVNAASYYVLWQTRDVLFSCV